LRRGYIICTGNHRGWPRDLLAVFLTLNIIVYLTRVSRTGLLRTVAGGKK